MKPFRFITVLFLFLFGFLNQSDAQAKWWRYGLDEMVVIQVRQQPKIIDTLGQTFFLSETEYGTILINKMNHAGPYYSQADLERFNKSLLTGMTMSGELKLLSHHADTLNSIPCIRFTFEKPSQNLLGEGAGLVVGDHTYAFQFVFTPENATYAVRESEYFFNNMEFNTFAGTINSPANRLGYFIGMGIGVLSIILVPVALIGLVFFSVRYFRKKKRAREGA